jgi:hypothetical protein
MVTSTRRKADLYFESEKFSCSVGSFPEILKRARLTTLGTMELWTCRSMLIRSIRWRDESLREYNAFLHDCRSSPRTNYAYIRKAIYFKRIFLYLRILELDIELIIHERLEPRIITVGILLIAFEVHLADSFFTCKVTFDGNVTGIDE